MEKKKVFSRIGIALIVMIIFSITTGGILPNLLPDLFKGQLGMLLATYVGMYLLGIPVIILMTKKFEHVQLEKKKNMTIREFLKLYVLSLGGMYIVVLFFNILFSFFTNENMNIVDEVINQLDIIQLSLLMVIFAPIVEELIFRKLLYHLLAPFGIKTYIFTSAIIFGLFHMNFTQSIYAFWLGLILASLLYKTGNILYPILLHMAINFTGSIVPLMVSGNDIATVIFSLYIILMIILGVIFFVIFNIKRKSTLVLKLKQEKVLFKMALINPGMILYISFCLLMIFSTLIVQLFL